jgi:hypothetical protein
VSSLATDEEKLIRADELVSRIDKLTEDLIAIADELQDELQKLGGEFRCPACRPANDAQPAAFHVHLNDE